MTNAIYEPAGKAREYCERAVNLYRGCTHGCLYCYAPSCLYTTREKFHAEAVPRPGIIEAIRKGVPTHAGREILLCFTCDPYPHSGGGGVTRQAIEVLHAGGCRVTILTKGGARSTADFDLLGQGDKYGATLTFIDASQSVEWEPGAALPDDRIRALAGAYDKGISTWANLEPVIDPEQTLELIRQTHGIVDLYKVGRWHHYKRANEIDWTDFAARTVALLQKLGKKYMIKKDLAVYLPIEQFR